MQKLDKIYEAYSDEIKLLLQYISKSEPPAERESSVKLLNYVNIISQMNESLSDLKNAIVNIDIKLNLVVLGKFNSGKSSFINQLTGKSIAVTDEAEMTYSLNYITHGKEFVGRILYQDGKNEEFKIDELNRKIFEERYNKEYSESIKHIEYCYPYAELENINLWDTPGLGATNIENKNKTTQIINESDVVLWIMDGTALGDTVDKEYISQLVNTNIPVICIINKIDLLQEYDDYKNQILEELNIIYPEVFKAVFFCSSLLEKELAPDNQMESVKEYLTDKIYRRKKELILASSINKGINILQNVYDTLESYALMLKEQSLRYENYTTSIKRLMSKEIDGIKYFVEEYLNNNLFVEEINQLALTLENGVYNSEESIKEVCGKYINDESLQKYICEVDNIVKNKFVEIWQKAIIKSHDEIYLEDKLFYFSNYHLETEKLNVRKDPISSISTFFNEASLAIGGLGAVFSILLHSILPIVGAVAYIYLKFANSKESNPTKNTIRNIDKTELEKLRINIRQEYLLKNLYPRLDEATKKILSVVAQSAEAEFLNYSKIDTIKETIAIIDKYLPTSERFKELLNGELSLIDTDELFTANLKNYSDFILLRSNPNPGIELLQQILSKATGYLYIVDPYFNDKSLGWIKYVNKDLSVKILLYSIDEDIENHNAFMERLQNVRSGRNGSIFVRIIKYKYQKGTPIHDRFIFTSSYGMQLGNGLDAIGKRDISITFLKEHKQFKEQFFDYYWNANTIQFEEREKQIIKYDV